MDGYVSERLRVGSVVKLAVSQSTRVERWLHRHVVSVSRYHRRSENAVSRRVVGTVKSPTKARTARQGLNRALALPPSSPNSSAGRTSFCSQPIRVKMDEEAVRLRRLRHVGRRDPGLPVERASILESVGYAALEKRLSLHRGVHPRRWEHKYIETMPELLAAHGGDRRWFRNGGDDSTASRVTVSAADDGSKATFALKQKVSRAANSMCAVNRRGGALLSRFVLGHVTAGVCG